MNLEPPFNIGIYGKPKSGKSHLIQYLISSYCKEFDFVVIISPTIFDGKYNYCKELGIKTVSLLSANNIEEKLQTIMKKQEILVDKKIKNNILIVFDDIQGLFKNSSTAVSLNACYRHYNISLMFGIQNITSLANTSRINQSHAFIFKMTTKRELENLKDSFIFDMDMKEIKNYIFNGFNKPYKFLYINRDTDERKFLMAPQKIFKN